MTTSVVLHEVIDVLFDKLIYPKHPELTDWDIHEETLLLFVDTNLIDFTMSDIIEFETYIQLEEEYDCYTSDYFYEILSSDIINTVNRSFDLIDNHYKIELVLSS